MKKKKIIFVYIIFTFMLTSFADCEKLKNSPVSGLNQSETSNLPAQTPELTPAAQISAQSNTSIKDLTEEKTFELAVETLERKLALLNPVDSDDVEELQVVIDRRNSLVAQLMDVKRGYYDYLSKVRPNKEILELAERETVKILERELKLFNPKGFYNSKKRQAAIDHSNSLVAQLMNVKRSYYDYSSKRKK
jgi:hypothetical protein